MVYIFCLILLLPLFYYYGLLLVGGFSRRFLWHPSQEVVFKPHKVFYIAIPAHNEAAVILDSIKSLQKLEYPKDLYKIFLVADHCNDSTAEIARSAGVMVYERRAEPRGSKGAALSWLLQQSPLSNFDAVVIFDADTKVDRYFLRWMNDRLMLGDKVIQGQHVIANAHLGWFPALTEALFFIDNVFQNAGRDALACSAKLMGDSVCFSRDIFDELSWGTSLTEDYQLRQRLLLAGHRISFEERARGYGEAPPTWKAAKVQRTRWMQGSQEVAKAFNATIRRQARKLASPMLVEASIESILPCFSTYAMFMVLCFVGTACGFLWGVEALWLPLATSSLGLLLLLLFPILGLLFAQAPARSYLALCSGPYFIAWRTLMATKVKLGFNRTLWVRTEHGAVS